MKSLFLLLSLLIGSSCQIGPSNQDDDLNFSPGNERQMDNVEADRITTFCQSINRYRKVLKSSGINDDVKLKKVSNTCSNSDLTTTTVDAVYDLSLGGSLYYQTAEELCQEKIWTDQEQPLTSYCSQITAGNRSDRITIELSLFVFSAVSDPTYGTKVNIKEFSVDPVNADSYTFQRAHSLLTQTRVMDRTYGKVVGYEVEETCDNGETSYCSQIEQ